MASPCAGINDIIKAIDNLTQFVNAMEVVLPRKPEITSQHTGLETWARDSKDVLVQTKNAVVGRHNVPRAQLNSLDLAKSPTLMVAFAGYALNDCTGFLNATKASVMNEGLPVAIAGHILAIEAITEAITEAMDEAVVDATAEDEVDIEVGIVAAAWPLLWLRFCFGSRLSSCARNSGSCL